MPDKLSTFLIPSQLSKPFSHPVGIPPQELHTVIAAYGDTVGLPMDWTKSRALCNPTPRPSGHPFSTIHLILRCSREEEHIPSNLPGLCIRRQIERYWRKKFSSLFFFLLLSLQPVPTPFTLRSFPRLYSTFPSAPTNAWRFSVAEHTSESRLNELFINTMLLMRWAISPDS